MEIIPAIDLRDGAVVQLVGGDFGKEQVRIADVLGQVRAFEEAGARRLHVVDLDAAKGTGDNIEVVKNIIRGTYLPVQTGGGVRTIERAVSLIDAGARQVIVGTAAVCDDTFLPALADRIGKERILVALDYKEGRVVTHGWDARTGIDPLSLGKKLGRYCAGFLLTCVDKEGKLGGTDSDYLQKFKAETGMRVIASGGVGSLDDIVALKNARVDAAVVGLAFYNCAVGVKEAIRAAGTKDWPSATDVVVASSYAIDTLIRDNGKETNPGGPARFICKVLEEHGVGYRLVTGKPAQVEIDMRQGRESGRIISVGEIPQIAGEPDLLLVSTLLDEYSLKASGKMSCVDLQGYVRDGSDFGKKRKYDSPELERFTIVKATQEELDNIPAERAARLNILLVTDGARGFEIKHDGVTKKYAVERVTPKDTIGAGDTFFSAFCMSYYLTRDIDASASFARDVTTKMLLEK
jgi:phosphoribosylformimino-5-aminoimidazole carboxamide ribotide isomerase